MAILTWSDEYKVNIRVIDDEHRALFDLVNSIDDGARRGDGGKTIASGLAALLRYARDHFPDEEKFITQSGYPRLTHHAAEHEKFTRTITRHKERFESDPEGFDVDAFLTYLAGWVSGHVLHADKEIAPYLKGEK
jgi:hemerythrin